MVHNVLCTLSSTWVIRGPVSGRNCLLLCAGAPVTSQVLIGWPPQRNEIRTSPLPTCVCSLGFYPLRFYPLFYSLVSPVLSSIRTIRSIGLLFSRPHSLTLTVRAVILFTAILSTLLLRDTTVFISVDRSPCLLQKSSSRPWALLRLSSSRRPTCPRAQRRLPIFESIRATCLPRRHISSLRPVRPDSRQFRCGCCDFSSIPAPISECINR